IDQRTKTFLNLISPPVTPHFLTRLIERCHAADHHLIHLEIKRIPLQDEEGIYYVSGQGNAKFSISRSSDYLWLRPYNHGTLFD
ncbi:hypothetical protein AAVH_39709, partial [Aphelenchoides avenae]